MSSSQEANPHQFLDTTPYRKKDAQAKLHRGKSIFHCRELSVPRYPLSRDVEAGQGCARAVCSLLPMATLHSPPYLPHVGTVTEWTQCQLPCQVMLS